MSANTCLEIGLHLSSTFVRSIRIFLSFFFTTAWRTQNFANKTSFGIGQTVLMGGDESIAKTRSALNREEFNLREDRRPVAPVKNVSREAENNLGGPVNLDQGNKKTRTADELISFPVQLNCEADRKRPMNAGINRVTAAATCDKRRPIADGSLCTDR